MSDRLDSISEALGAMFKELECMREAVLELQVEKAGKPIDLELGRTISALRVEVVAEALRKETEHIKILDSRADIKELIALNFGSNTGQKEICGSRKISDGVINVIPAPEELGMYNYWNEDDST